MIVMKSLPIDDPEPAASLCVPGFGTYRVYPDVPGPGPGRIAYD